MSFETELTLLYFGNTKTRIVIINNCTYRYKHETIWTQQNLRSFIKIWSVMWCRIWHDCRTLMRRIWLIFLKYFGISCIISWLTLELIRSLKIVSRIDVVAAESVELAMWRFPLKTIYAMSIRDMQCFSKTFCVVP